MFLSACIPALLLLSLVIFSPGESGAKSASCIPILTSTESPRWLLKESGASEGYDGNGTRIRKLIQDAYLSLIDLRGEPVPIIAAGEIFLMHTRLIDEQHRLADELPHNVPTAPTSNKLARSERRLMDEIHHISWWSRVKLMFFYSGFTRRAHLAAAAVMISQQLCGISLLVMLVDTFFRYSITNCTTPKENTRLEEDMQLLGFSLGLMALNFLATIVALFFIDKSNGRRALLNWSFPIMATSLLASALVLKSPGGLSPGVIAGHYIFLALFMIAYSIGEGPAAFVISAEVFPLVSRELGMSLAVFWNFLGAGILAVIAPALLQNLGQFGALLLFSETKLLPWFLCYWLVPNTGNEDLEDVFEQLDITSGFMLKHTLETLLRKATKPVDYCVHRGSKRWRDCGYGKRLESSRVEFDNGRRGKVVQFDADTNHAATTTPYRLHWICVGSPYDENCYHLLTCLKELWL
jgi:hypothetical protein